MFSRFELGVLYELARDNRQEQTVDVYVSRVLKVTQQAALIVVDGQSYWLPLSQIRGEAKLDASRAWKRHVEVSLWWVRSVKLKGYA